MIVVDIYLIELILSIFIDSSRQSLHSFNKWEYSLIIYFIRFLDYYIFLGGSKVVYLASILIL